MSLKTTKHRREAITEAPATKVTTGVCLQPILFVDHGALRHHNNHDELKGSSSDT